MIRAFLSRMLNILAFTISKSHFINFNISLYNPPNIKTSIILPLHLNILFLCFLYSFFLFFQITTIKQILSNIFFFTILLQWAARHSSSLQLDCQKRRRFESIDGVCFLVFIAFCMLNFSIYSNQEECKNKQKNKFEGYKACNNSEFL